MVGEAPLRVVIVDDDERLASAVAEVLEADDRFVVAGRAADGNEAVRIVEQEAPDLVLMDIAMPGLDGIAATRLIRSRDSGQHVVIYTGSEEYGDVARADEAGAAGFLHKSALTSPDLADALLVLHANFVAGRTDPD